MNTVKLFREILICFILMVVFLLILGLFYNPVYIGSVFGSFWNGFIHALQVPLK